MGWGDYVKVKKIGEGSFGAAWLVKSNKENQQFVVKQINVSRMPTKEREEARKEVSVLAQMKHPNIVSYIDSFEELGNLCIVMDYCDGGDLYNRIQSQRGVPLNEEQILDWFVQITLALKHVHDRKILHRDLKSQNIFLNKDGVVKLGDFGVAKVLGSTMELARTAIGTPYYMSPEICEHKPYNNKSDVWSLGCVLYELANMRHPFEANSMQMLVYKILRGNYDQVNPKYSYELRNLVASMLKRNPRERPSVNGILRNPFILKRCQKFLTNEKLNEEFSHTVLHGENFKHKIQNQNILKPAAARVVPSPRPSSAIGQPIIHGGVPAAAPKSAYDAAKIYKNPVVPRNRPNSGLGQVRNSVEKKNQEVPKKPSVVPRGPSVERESHMSFLEQQRLKKQQEEAKKHQELIEKQKLERIRKAREEGWKNVIFGQSGNEDKDDYKIDPYPFVNPNRGIGSPVAAAIEPSSNMKQDPYARHHQKLDEHAQKRKELEEHQQAYEKMISAGVLKPKISQAPDSPLKPTPPPMPRNVQKPIIKESINDEFIKRKAEFARNKARGKGLLNNPLVAKPPQVRRDEKSLYEDKLRKIRLQNYNKKKILVNQKDIQRESIDYNSQKKLAALRQQSEEQRMKFNNELEKKRNEAYIKEQRAKPLIEKKESEPKLTNLRPTSAVSMTEVLGAIGVVGKQMSKAEVLKNPDSSVVMPTPRERDNKVRKSWQKGTDLSQLDNKTLVQTGADETKEKAKPEKKPSVSPRKAWDLPHATIIKAFELADLSPINTKIQGTLIDNKTGTTLKGSETFIVDKKHLNVEKENERISSASSTSSSISNIINERQPTLVDVNERTLKIDKNDFIISPEKMATLKATKNLLLGVTLGQFDPKNTKMLRTCSEPDVTGLFNFEEIINPLKEATKKPTPKEKSDNMLLTANRTSRLVKSLEDLSKIEPNPISSDSDESDEDSVKKSKDSLVELWKTLQKNDSSSSVDESVETDDVIEVRQTMELLLNDYESDEEGVVIPKSKAVLNPKSEKKAVNFASGKKLVSEVSASIVNQSLFDSLEPGEVRKSTALSIDDKDSEFIGEDDENNDDNNDNDSDTEFEDDAPMPMPDTIKITNSYHLIEEKRHSLEKQLGTKKFCQAFRSLQKLILSEDVKEKKQSRKSYIQFFETFPKAPVELYDELNELVRAENEFENGR